MCDKEDCMRTFPNSWYDQESPTPHELVNAGFYYMGSGDRVSCFYCGGRLFHWKLRDNPCVVRACKVVSFVRICSKETRCKICGKSMPKTPNIENIDQI